MSSAAVADCDAAAWRSHDGSVHATIITRSDDGEKNGIWSYNDTIIKRDFDTGLSAGVQIDVFPNYAHCAALLNSSYAPCIPTDPHAGFDINDIPFDVENSRKIFARRIGSSRISSKLIDWTYGLAGVRMYDAQTTDLTQTTWEDVNTRNQTKMIVNFGHGNYGPEPVRSVTQEIHWAGANSFYMLSATDGQDQALQWTKEDYAALMPTPKEQADAYAGMDYLWRNPSQSEIPTIRWDDYAAYRETPQGQETQVVVEDDVWTEVSGPSRRRKGKSRN